MTDKYEKACVKLQTKNQNVICHLVGLSLEIYNTLETCLMANEQLIIEEAVYHANHAINTMKADSNMDKQYHSFQL